MWEKLSKHFLIFCVSLILIVFIVFPYCISRILEKNTLNSYVKNEYYILCKEMSIKYIGNNAHANIHGVHGDRHRWWISAYEMKMPFMEKLFEVWIDKRNNKIFGDNFYEVLSTDAKFQHLYCDWVKKQVGIDDENVEFRFTGFFDKPYIEFDKIVSLNSDYEEIFENTHNLFAWLCERTQIKDLSENNKVEKAKHLQEYLLSAMQFTGISNDTSENFSGCVRLSSGSFNKEKDLNFEFNFDARDNKHTLKSYIVGTGWVTYE